MLVDAIAMILEAIWEGCVYAIDYKWGFGAAVCFIVLSIGLPILALWWFLG